MANEMDVMRMDERQRESWLRANRSPCSWWVWSGSA